MTKKQLAALFTINLGLNTMGVVVAALLPIVAGRMGADSALSGLYLSATAASVAAGNFLAGWLSDRLQRRKLVLITAGVVQIISLWLVGQAVNLVQLFAFTMATGLMVGVQITTVGILAGLFAQESERGRVFGLIASAGALGSLIGGLGSGPIVDHWGFSGFFTAAALVTFIQPLTGLLVQDKQRLHATRSASVGTGRSALLAPTFVLLFLASVLVFVTNGIQGMGRSLLMDKLGFDAAAITSTVAVSGLISLPFPFVMGWLSDRIGRRPLLMCCYVGSTVSLLILAGSVSLWHFWVSTALQTLLGASLGIGSALVTDLVPDEALGSGLALFGATNFIGLVIGFAVMGAAVQSLGMVPTLLFSALVGLIAAGLLIPIRKSSERFATTGVQSA